MSILKKFDLESLVKIVETSEYHKIALQFPDDLVEFCIDVYQYLKPKLHNADIFITADSTWGSSIDDVSAMHDDADLIVYFGSDLSSSGSLPVVILPLLLQLDLVHCTDTLLDAVKVYNPTSLVILYELGYAHCIDALMSNLQHLNPVAARLPISADIINWDSRKSDENDTFMKTSLMKLGGLYVQSDILCKSGTVLVFVGEKNEQITNIALKASSHTLLCYSPLFRSCTTLHGNDTIEFRQRYGGVLRVREAKVIGIIISSMGLTAEDTKQLVQRLQALIVASGKASYCFVMGRLNESKLCNFPEVDLFCLVANDDNAYIKPKTFHVPVITPFELELGLEAREWQSTFSTDIDTILNEDDNGIEQALLKVKVAYASEDSDDAEVTDDQLTLTNVESNSEQQLTSFNSAVIEHFNNRNFKGLVPEVSDIVDVSVKTGNFGTSVSYTSNFEKSVV